MFGCIYTHLPLLNNDLAKTLSIPSSGFGARLDAIMVEGISRASIWDDYFNVTDTDRPSDHNLVVSTFRLPKRARGAGWGCDAPAR